MKSIWASLILVMIIPSGFVQQQKNETVHHKLTPAANIFIITTDGFRWQELFNGADSLLLNSDEFTSDAETLATLYWAETKEERRKKLMPFFWSVIAAKGQIYGNRGFDNKVNTANAYSISYPGYNEIFTGMTDLTISSNGKNYNSNINVLEYLNTKPAFAGKVVAFTSWDVFPYILNEMRSGMLVNSGYESIKGIKLSQQQAVLNTVQEELVNEKTATRYDQLTFVAAKEYIKQYHPRVVYLGLGETDEFAHQGRYDLYLEQANKVDRMISELWHLVQTTPGYKNNSIFIITTDHGRGSRSSKWTSHGEFIRGSSQAWLAVIGAGITPIGEIKEKQQLYQQQIAQTIAGLAGEEFTVNDIAPALSLK
jgi:Metalloenzyme superfamily